MITQVNTAALSKVDGAYSLSSVRAKFNNQTRALTFSEMFQNDVNLSKLGHSVPHLKSYVECFTNVNGTLLSKTEHFVFLLDLFLKQHDSLIPCESFEQFLKEGHWIPKSVSSDAEVQEKVCDKEDKIRAIGEKRFTENEKDSADVKDGIQVEPGVLVEHESEYNVQMDEKKEVGVVEMAHSVTSIAGNVAEELICVKEANESRSTLEKPNKQKLANYRDILFSCVILHEIIVIFLQMSQNLLCAGVCFLTFIQTAEHVFKILFCQAKEVIKEIVRCTILTHCQDNELYSVADAVQRSINGDEVVSRKLLSVMKLMVNEKPRTGAKADHSNSKEIENLEHGEPTADGAGRSPSSVIVKLKLENSGVIVGQELENSGSFIVDQELENSGSVIIEHELENICSVNDKQELENSGSVIAEQKLENSTMSTCPNKEGHIPEDVSVSVDMNVTSQWPKAYTSHSYSVDHSVAERHRNSVMGNETQVVANHSTPNAAVKYTETETSEKQEHSSVQDKQNLGQCPLRSTKSGGKSCSIVGWLFLIVLCSCFVSTLATSDVAELKVIQVNVTVGEQLILRCPVSDSESFRWKWYPESPKGQENLFDSRNSTFTKSYTNFTVSRDGTMTFPSAKLLDTGEYHCLVFSDTIEETVYYVHVQNFTVIVAQVIPTNMTESKRPAVTGYVLAGAFGFVTIIAVVVGVVSHYICKVRKQKAKQAARNENQQRNDRNSTKNGMPNRVSVEATSQSNGTAEPLVNGMPNSISVGPEATRLSNGTAEPLMQNGSHHCSV